MEKSRYGAFVYAQKVLKHSLFLFGDYIQLCTIYIKQKPDND